MPFSNDLLNFLRQLNSNYDLTDEHQLAAAAIRYADKLIDAGISVPKNILRHTLLRTPIDLSKVKNFDSDLYIYAFISDFQDNVLDFIPENKRTPFIERLAFEFNGPKILKSLKNPSYDFQLWATIRLPETLLYLSNPSEEILRQALLNRPCLFPHLDGVNVSKEVIDFVLEQRPCAAKYFSKDTPVEELVVNNHRPKPFDYYFRESIIEYFSMLDSTDAYCKEIIEDRPSAFLYFNFPTLDLFKTALARFPYSIYRMAQLSDEAIELALENDAGAIELVEDLNSDWIEKFAQSKDPGKYWKIQCIPPEFQTDELCIRLINSCQKHGNQAYTMFSLVFNQSEDVCKAALKKDCRALKYIRNPLMYEKMKSFVQKDLGIREIPRPKKIKRRKRTQRNWSYVPWDPDPD